MPKQIKNPLAWEELIKYDRSYNLMRREYSDREIRQEYTRLRDIARKRVKALQKAGFSNTNIVQSNITPTGELAFKKLRDISSNEQIAAGLSQMARFLFSKVSTVSGIKEKERKTLAALRERGLENVNRSNLATFGRLMDQLKARKLDMIYDSERVAEMMDWAERKNVPISFIDENFDLFYQNYEVIGSDIDKQKRAAARKGQSFDISEYLKTAIELKKIGYKGV